MPKKTKTVKPPTKNAATDQSKSKSNKNATGSKKNSKKSKSTPESTLPRLPDVCWHQIVSFALTDIGEQFDVIDDLQGANTLRNCTLVSQEWNAAMNNDLLWSLVWNDWKSQRNAHHGDGSGTIHSISHTSNYSRYSDSPRLNLQIGGSNGEQKVLHYFPGKKHWGDHLSRSKDSTGLSNSSGEGIFNLRLAPPHLRVMSAPQLDDLGIIIGENNCIKKGFAAAFSETLSTCCIHCRIIPLDASSLVGMQGDVVEVRAWKNVTTTHNYYYGEGTYEQTTRTEEETTHEKMDANSSMHVLVDPSKKQNRQSSRPRKVINYKETTQMEDDRTMKKEDIATSSSSSASSSSSSTSSTSSNYAALNDVQKDFSESDLLCHQCRGLGKQTNTNSNGFTRGILLATSRAQYEYAATKGQLSPLPHEERTWYGKPSKIYLRRHVITSSRGRFGSFSKMLERKNKKKTKAPGTLRDSKMLCGLYLSWGYGGCTCGKHQGYYDY